MSKRTIHAVWCDDVRQEVGNKPSLMGVYINSMVFQSLPIVMPRLSVFVWISTPKDTPFEKLVVKIVRDDGFVIIEIDPNIQEILNNSDTESRIDSTMYTIITGLSLSAIEIPEDCKYFKLIVETETETIESQKMYILTNGTDG